MSEESLLISRFQVRGLSGSPVTPAPSNNGQQHPMPATIVTWTFAPEWLTPAEAAGLMGAAYSAESIMTLVAIGAIVAEPTAMGWLVEKRSLQEYQDALLEVVN